MVSGGEPFRLEPFVITGQLAAEHRGHVHDDDRCPCRVRIHVQQMVDADVEPASSRASRTAAASTCFASIDEAAGKHPPPVPRLDGAADQHDVIVAVADDRADRDLRILVEDEPAAPADEPVRFGRLERPQIEVAAAERTEAVGTFVVGQHRPSALVGRL